MKENGGPRARTLYNWDMTVGNEFCFRIEYHTEENTIDAAFALGDLLEESPEVEEWKMDYKACECGNHVSLTGTVTTFISGDDLVAVGENFAERAQDLDGFLKGICRPVPVQPV